MQFSLEQIIIIASREFNLHKYKLVFLFAFISLLALVLGIVWPKHYSAFSTIFSDEQNIIRPLMEGRAATTNVTDRVRLARELIFSQKILTAVLTEAGMINDTMSPIERERLFDAIQKDTDISRVGNNLLKIEYTGTDAQRTFLIAKRFAELFIQESLDAQRKESLEAYTFIDSQVKEYHKKLTDAEDKLKDFRSENINAAPGNENEVSTRITTLQQRIEQAKLELHETNIKKQSLENQLSGEAEVTVALSKEGQYRNRIAELQTEIETLRVNYLDTHPDIVRLKHQIEDLKEAINAERKKREEYKNKAKAGNKTFVDEGISTNPLYQQLRSELSQTKTLIATLESRIIENENLLNHEIRRAKQIHGVEANLAELSRDYNVNKDIYQDLLRRRENARVSMNLGIEAQGPSLKIQEPARLPIRPSGLRFFHFMLGGLALGIVLPIGIIYLLVSVDPRIRSESVISNKLQLPVLVVLPPIMTNHDKHATQRDLRNIGVIVATVALIYILAGVLKIVQVI
ncbi:MAG: hypothetical protein HY080_15590 [Gammaproteobacteria bacterium]|nr:hypothetical protein [Gammaproteobacteria bacterium]